MIRGISRQIIEVNQIDNRYFEKAWLVVKPEYSSVGASAIEREADSYLTTIKPPYNLTNKKLSVRTLMNTLVSVLFGCALTAAIMQSGLF